MCVCVCVCVGTNRHYALNCSYVERLCNQFSLCTHTCMVRKRNHENGCLKDNFVVYGEITIRYIGYFITNELQSKKIDKLEI